MANRITIPTLKAQITPLRIPDIDIERNPYATVAASLGELGKAVNERARWAPSPDDGDDGEPPGSPPHAERAPRVREWWRAPYYSFDDYLRQQAEVRRRRRTALIDETLDDLADSAFKDPARIGDYRDDADGLLDTLTDDERKAHADARRRINEQYFRGLIRDNPKLALETLRSRAGVAEEELGISEETREDLEADAQRAYDAEQSRIELQKQAGTLQVAVWTNVYARFPKNEPGDASRWYYDVIDAFDWDAKSVDWLEPQIDKTVREVEARAKAVVKAARKIVAGDAGRWDELERVEALDTFAKSVIGADAWTTPARHRMVWFSRAANRAPDVVREYIRTGVNSRDAGKRAFTGRLLMDLEDRLLDWATPDIRAFGFDFAALAGAGFSDHVAVKRIEAGTTLTPERQDARRHSFRARLDGTALSDALNEVLEFDEEKLGF